MRIEILDENLEQKYSDFLLKSEKTFLYASIKYRNLLRNFLGCQDHYLVALSKNEIKGVMPLFFKKNSKYGTVFNSLPFYGSNGAIIDDDYQVKRFLLNHYRELTNSRDVVAETIITSPFEKDHSFYDKELKYHFKETRIGQITIFPESSDKLMDTFHQKTRNAVRKGMKMNLLVRWEDGLDYFNFLFLTHQENMTKIEVAYKPKSFFELIPQNFEYGKDYRIYVALAEGEPIAALLSFYFNKTVEYYIPATIEQYREYQPMSLIIYEAMKDALNDGYKYWNWGGTAPNQKGVYDFKKRWGTSDFNYYYYTTIKDKQVKYLTKKTLLDEFQYFFVLPFDALKSIE